MPIYEYHCNECGKEFEKLVSFLIPTPTRPIARSANQPIHTNVFPPSPPLLEAAHPSAPAQTAEVLAVLAEQANPYQAGGLNDRT